MEDFLQQPDKEDAPVQKNKAPWQRRVEYKSGKVQEAFAATATPAQIKAGFSYYDKEAKASIHLNGFTASIVAVLSGVSGTVPNGPRYDNYYSSLVQDTRIQKMAVYLGSGENKVLVAKGIYNDFKHELPNGVGYMKFAVCYLHEENMCVLMELTASFENAIKEAIADKTGQAPSRINLFNLFELSSKYWAVRFNGNFMKRNRDGGAWTGKGDMFFYPELVAGVVLTEKFPVLSEISQQVSDYVAAGQSYFANKKQEPSQSDAIPQNPTERQGAREYPRTAPSSDDFFPTEEPKAPIETEDLPF